MSDNHIRVTVGGTFNVGNFSNIKLEVEYQTTIAEDELHTVDNHIKAIYFQLSNLLNDTLLPAEKEKRGIK